MTAIDAVGAHVPRFRLDAEAVRDALGRFAPSGVDAVAVPGPDEDALTMGVEAAERALAAATVEPSSLTAVAIGTTSPPLDEGDMAAQTVDLLGLPRSVETAVFTQSTRAGTRALVSAANLRDGPTLAIASDAPTGAPDDALGQGAGAGAVALVLTDDGPVTVGETGSTNRVFPGTRYRERGENEVKSYGATSYERRAYAESIGAAVAAVEDDADAIAPQAPDGAMPYRATNELGGDPAVYQAATSLGDTGAVSPLFGLLEAWGADERDVLVVGYGGGSADAIRLRGQVSPRRSPVPTTDLTYAEALELRGEVVSQGGGV